MMQRSAAPYSTWSSWAWAGTLSLLLLILQAVGDATTLALRLDAVSLSHHQWWRLITAHFVHLGWPHTLLNVAGVWLCCALAPAVFDRWLFWRVTALALGISLCLWRFFPDALPYVGLSGVLYGLFASGLAPRALRRDLHAMAALLVVTVWMLWPLLLGTWRVEEDWIGGAVVTAAHLCGYGLALIAWAVVRSALSLHAAANARAQR